MRLRRETHIEQGDPLIPILNLVCMLIPLLLYGAVFVKMKVLDVQAPKMTIVDGPPTQNEDALQLRVIVSDQGFHIKVNPKFRKAWMAEAGTGPDIPKTDAGFDFEELHRKLRELKTEHNKEQSILIGAEDDIEYEVLIKTMDFTRGSTEHPLFPDVQLTRTLV